MKNKDSKGKGREKRFEDVEFLAKRVKEETPKPGDYLYDYRIEALRQEFSTENQEDLSKKLKLFFRDLPVSKGLLKGLTQRGFTKLTEVQRCVIPHAVGGRDVVVASRTGSGKTLAYLIPLVEDLYRQKWNPMDNLGAMVILPTRELAIQVFEVLQSITEHMEINIGLCIGGKDLKSEQDRLSRMSILICTPGRLLQHLDVSYGFETDNLRVLVFDEADEILSHGFSDTIDQILERIPNMGRQTMLFSATMNKDVKSLVKLAMNKPENIFQHEVKFNQKNKDSKDDGQTASQKVKKMGNIYETPVNQKQYYMVTKLEDKIDFQFSFLKSHPNCKILVFVNTAKQVRFIYETYKKLKPGNSILELHGRQKQNKRMAIFFTFQEKKFATLVTTNVAARGLDFPTIDWVIQLDVPENVETYVHRIGRTARHKSAGKSQIFISEYEMKFVEKLKNSSIEICELKPNPQKMLTIKSSLESMLSESNELKYLAQRAFISYVKSINHMGDKQVFDVRNIDATKYAQSMGMIQIPVQKFKGEEESEEEQEMGSNDSEDEVIEHEKGEVVLLNAPSNSKNKKLDKLKQKIKENKLKKQKVQQEEQDEKTENFVAQKNALNLKRRQNTGNAQETAVRDAMQEHSSDDDDLLVKKRSDKQIDIDALQFDKWKLSKNQMKKVKLDGHYAGKNIMEIDAKTGNLVSQADLNREDGYKKMKKVIEQDTDYFEIYKGKLDDHEEEDLLLEAARQKVKRDKKKDVKKMLEHDGKARFGK